MNIYMITTLIDLHWKDKKLFILLKHGSQPAGEETPIISRLRLSRRQMEGGTLEGDWRESGQAAFNCNTITTLQLHWALRVAIRLCESARGAVIGT